MPAFTSAFASGWLIGAWKQASGLSREEGAIHSKASISGLLAALVACVAAYGAHLGAAVPTLPLILAIALLFLSLLPSALFATLGANFGRRARERQTVLGGTWGHRERVLALALSAILPAVGVLVWPTIYMVGKVLEKPPAVAVAAPPPVVAPPPQPRYVKPEGFDSANAWKRIVSHEDAIPNADSKSPVELSHDERRIAFVTRERGERQLAVRHLFDPGPDYSLTLEGGIAAMAWSPDDKRIIFLSGVDGAFWVCVPESDKMIRLPIPVLQTDQRHALVWWREESVVVYPSRGDPGILSLDSLRITSATKDPEWSKLPEDERVRIGQEAFPPDMGRTATAKFSFIGGTGDASRTLVISDDESLYARLAASAGRGFTSSFPNRDGSMFFIMEPERLRILYMGLRQSPSLRFVADAKSAFPPAPAAKAALGKRAVRAAVAAPIINPLNGKTVAGDPRAIKGFARFIAADDKTCTVWIEQERQPIREGDVLMTLSAIQDGDEYSVSPDWWAVIRAADDSQSIPRRADVVTLPPSSTRALLPLPEPPPKQPASENQSRPNVSASAPQPEMPPPTSITGGKTNPPKEAAPPPTKPLSDEERLKQFIFDNTAAFSRGDIDGTVSGYGVIIDVGPNKSVTRDDFASQLRRNRAGKEVFTETPLEPIEVKRLGGARFSLSYVSRIVIREANSPQQTVEVLSDLEVLLTSQGPKIVKQRESVLKAQPNRRNR